MLKIKTFKEHLLESTNIELDTIDILMSVLEDVDIANAKLTKSIYGLTLHNRIYVDIDGISRNMGNNYLLFIILHELAHYKKIKTMGKDWYLNFNLKYNFEEYFRAYKFEEDFANRWATYMMDKLFTIEINHKDIDYETYPYNEFIKSNYNMLRGYVKNEDELDNYLNNFILHVRQ